MAGADYIEGGVEKMKRAGRKLIGMAAAWLLAASAFSMAVYAADGFSSEYERLLDTASILSDEEQDEITELLDELSERQKMDVTVRARNNQEEISITITALRPVRMTSTIIVISVTAQTGTV